MQWVTRAVVIHAATHAEAAEYLTEEYGFGL